VGFAESSLEARARRLLFHGLSFQTIGKVDVEIGPAIAHY
jgi:hypothetical protein